MNNGATSWPKAPGVAEALAQFLTCQGANAGRGTTSSRDLSTMVGLLATRQKLAAFFGCGDPRWVTFTANVSESLNIILLGFLKEGMTVVTSSMEHNAVARPLTLLSKRGVEVRKVPCSPRGEMDLDAFTKALKGADLAVCTHASNVCGTLMPLEELAKACAKEGVPFVVDAAQTAGHLPLSLEGLGLAALCFTGHKGLLGPQGTGGVVWSEDFARRVEPLITGGTGSLSESLDQPAQMPDKFETGTLNLPGIAGLSVAIDYLSDRGLESLARREEEICARFLEGLSVLPVELYGLSTTEGRTNVFALNAPGADNAAWADALSSEGVETRPGLHCSPWAHQTLGTFPQGCLRLSPGLFTTDDELDETLTLLDKTLHHLKP